MKDNVGQRAPAHRSPRQDPCFDPLIRSPVSRDSRAAASGSFLDWKGLRLRTCSRQLAAAAHAGDDGGHRPIHALSIGRRPPKLHTASRISTLLSRLRNSWGFRLGAVLNSPGEHPFALDRRLDAGSGGPAARREVEVGLFRRVADRAPGHGWVTDAHRAPKGRCRRCAGYVTRRTSWSAVSASTPNMQ